MGPTKRSVFFVSDGTGLTAEALGHSLLTQFERVEFTQIRIPFVDNLARAQEAVARINGQGEADGMPAGPVMAKVPRIIKVPAGEAYVGTENPLGEMGYYIVSKGDLAPFRVKIRSASFNNVSITPWILKGVYVPDIVTILGSLYFILGDIDR